MNKNKAQDIINKRYGDDASKLDYLEHYAGKYIFGFINKSTVLTIDEPFYITVDDNGDVEEVAMPMYVDGAYDESRFATLEARFAYFEKNKILDPVK